MKRRAEIKTEPNGGAAKASKSPKKSKPEETLPLGEVLRDSEGRTWSLDSVLGQGHIGPIYSASSACQKDTSEYVVKIEPMVSGHLFKEINFYQRVAKKKLSDTWMKQHSLQQLGIPHLTGTGQHTHDDIKYRFLVLQRLGPDLQSLQQKCGALLSVETILWTGIKMLDCLEYIHSHEYVHADITASNILLGYNDGDIDDSKVYLVDYGLSHRYMVDGKQKPYLENPKIPSEGSVIFMSRDAHKGVAPSRRGDLEILGYCLLQWMCGHLPWGDNLTDRNYVRDSKIKYMENITSFVKLCCGTVSLETDSGASAEDAMISYFDFVSSLDYEEEPDYDRLREIFQKCLQEEWKPQLLSQKSVPDRQKLLQKEGSEKLKHGRKQKESHKKTVTVEEKCTVVESSSNTVKSLQVHQGGRPARKNKPQSSLPKEQDEVPVLTEETARRHTSKSKTKLVKGRGSQHDQTNQPSTSSEIQIQPSDISSKPKVESPLMQERVNLNVGGKTFVTLKSTLQKYPSKLSKIASNTPLQDEIFIDRDPTYFSYILNFFRDEQTTLPDSLQDMRRLREESVYYSITALTNRIDQLLG